MINFKSALAVAAIGAAFMASSAGELMSQNFDADFEPGAIQRNLKFATGVFRVQDSAQSMEIVNDAASAPNALKVGRKGVVGYVSFRADQAVPEGENFRVSFKVNLPEKNSVAVMIGGSGKAEPVGAVSLAGAASPRAYNQKKSWVSSGLPALPADQWVTVAIDFNAAARTYEVSVTYPDGKTITSIPEYPFLQADKVAEVRFLNAPPIGNYALIDDLVLESTGAGSASASVSGGLVFEQNFDRDFRVGSLAGGGRCTGAKWLVSAAPNNFAIVSDPVCSKPNALKIMRDGANGYFSLRPQAKIPANRDYTVEFSANVAPNSGTVLYMVNNIGVTGALLIQSDKVVSAYNSNSSWQKSADLPVIPADQWCKIQIKFNAAQNYYTISVTYPDGRTVAGATQYPCLAKGAVEELRFINILPQKSCAFVDDLKIICD